MISQNEIRSRAKVFAKEWAEEEREEAEAKSFWDDFFNVFGVSRRRVATFEHQVKKQDGAQGFIDVLWKGVLLAEHKTKGKSLDKAFVQAKDYLPGLKDAELPRFLIVSDFATMRLYDLDENTQFEFPVVELSSHIERFGFVSGYEVQQYEAEEQASIKAAELMADFHNAIATTGYSGHNLEVFLIRILFCLFADDTEIFPKSHFRTYITTRTSEDGSDLGAKLIELFDVLSREVRQTNIDEQLAQFPYINGDIFKESIASIHLDKTARDTLLKCCSFDWSGISAAIFGSLFQGVMDEKTRRELGAHYTSEINIMKVIQPLFLDELYNEFDAAKKSPRALDTFHDKLALLKFLDPACGCGNFLVTTYRELRRLEIQVLLKKRKHDKNTLMAFGAGELSRLHVNQFYGIEIEEFPALVARTAMYLADHQMTRELQKEFGHERARIPLEAPATIVHANALTTDWESVVSKSELSYILGNPPFYGARLMTKEQKADLVALFPKTLKGVGNLDFVTGWYEKAARYIQDTQIKVGLVSTNSITQGEQVGILWKYLHDTYGIVLHFAHQTFKWSNEAKGKAAVHCVIIGFADFKVEKKYLYTYKNINSDPIEWEVDNINAYLINADDVFIQNRSNPLCAVPSMVFGNMANDGGGLIIEDLEIESFLKSEPDAEKYIKRLVGSVEFINNKRRWCLWLVKAEPNEVKLMPEVLKRLEMVRQNRLTSTREATRKLASTPGLFGEIRQPDTDYLLIPRVSSANRPIVPIGYFDKDIIVTDRCAFIPEANFFMFGILTSTMHMTWMSYTCGRLKSDYNYSINIVYNNFPWPECVSTSTEIQSELKEKIQTAAQAVLNARIEFENASLADLYDPLTMPSVLQKAHQNLDRLVDQMYGYKDTGLESDRIAFLFDLYQKITN
jgi:hypothetical protein